MRKYLMMLLLAALGCSKPTSVSDYGQPLITFASTCGGFSRTDTTASLQKAMSSNDSLCSQYRISTSEYVAAEQIQWHYKAVDSILDIVHFRKVSNCASQWTSTYQLLGNTLLLEEINNGNSSDRCNCVFDQYCSVKVSSSVDTLKLAGKSWNIDLGKASGSFIIDTTSLLSLGVVLK
jgi:hypothetical protein